MLKLSLYILLFFIVSNTVGQSTDSVVNIKVHFMYGSKPRWKDRRSEYHWFGGIKGGHVSIEIDNKVIGFVPAGRLHIFSHKHKRHSGFRIERLSSWQGDTPTIKYTSVIIPLSLQKYQQLQNILQNYTDSTPYDYAFFGMRCAAATCEILSQLNILAKGNIYTNFYPQLFRRRLIKLAQRNHWDIIRHAGRPSRKWERE